MNRYRFCGYCGGKLIGKPNLVCSSCNKHTFKNSSPAVGAVVINNGKILLAKRAHPPLVGKFDVVGGFLDYGEHPEKGIIREFKEESNLDIKVVDFLGHYIDGYKFQDETIKVLVMMYLGKIIGGKEKARDDVASLHWIPIDKLPNKKDVAFSVISPILKDIQKWYKKNNK